MGVVTRVNHGKTIQKQFASLQGSPVNCSVNHPPKSPIIAGENAQNTITANQIGNRVK